MRIFDPDDYKIIQDWFYGHHMQAPLASYLPNIGFIEDYYCAGFLVQTDTPIALIDFVVTNPVAQLRARAEAVHSIIDTLIKEAKRRGFKAVKCDTQKRSIAKLSVPFKFADLGNFHTFYREL